MPSRSRPLVCALALGTAFALGACAHSERVPVQSVQRVDLDRYVGKWYEIAAFPMFFQRRCLGDVTAEYALRPDGDISVINRCRTEDGFDQASATAWAVEGTGDAQLEVSFFRPFRADYWIIGLDDDYRWAVVANPSRKYLWVLARTPQLPKAQLDRALRTAENQGFDLTQLKYTAHGRSLGAP